MSRTLGTTSNDFVLTRVGQSTIAASTTLTEADAGKQYNIATDALTVTLPLIEADNIGMAFLFRNTGADGANIITLSPNASDGIAGTIANAAADSVASGVVDKNLVNTKATANKGDYVIIRAVATTLWVIEGGVGIWASEA
jgi:hypothetical protein